MRTLHVVSHTHWDREWYRPFQLFRLQLVHLIDGLLDILEKDPEFRYFMLDGQTIVLDDYLFMRPEKEAVLRKHIQKGRILIGPWHILPDMFLVGPESHIRNLLQGDRTARRFGTKMMIGYMPDSFGHIGQGPQILRGFDINTASLWRGVKDQPTEFWWQSPDGSRVLMIYLRDGYGNGASLPTENLPAFNISISTLGDALATHSASSDYLIMLGTDHMEPPPNTSEAIAYADELLRDTHVVHSSLPKLVAAVQASMDGGQLPVVEGELRDCQHMHLLPGVLSTRIWLKQRNRACENILSKWVEPFTTWEEFVTGDTKQLNFLNQKSEIVRQTWRLLMENHPHDSICGCSIDQVHDEMKVRFDQVDQTSEELTQQSLKLLAANIQTQSEIGQSAFVVFNPSSSPRTDRVTVILEIPARMNEFDLVDENGRVLPFQRRGLGSRELITMVMDVKELRAALGNISVGRAAGMTIQDVEIRREGTQMFIDAIMTEGGEPNLSIWNTSLKQLETFMTDPTITSYNVRARSVSATQLVFAAPEVPSLGYRTFWVRGKYGTIQPVRFNPLSRLLIPLGGLILRSPLGQRLTDNLKSKPSSKPAHKIENEHFVVEVKKDGRLSVIGKKIDATFSGLNRFLDSGDCGDEYNYAPPPSDLETEPRLKSVRAQCGPVQQTLEVAFEMKTPASLTPDRKARSRHMVTIPLVTRITLTSGVPRIDIQTEVENIARDHRLRVLFPAPFPVFEGHYDGHFEVVCRPVDVPTYDDTWVEQPRPEVPQRAFTDVSDGNLGLMIANCGLPEVEVLKNDALNTEIALTLLRCVGWLSRDDFSTRKGHAGTMLETPGAQMNGKWKFEYSIIPHIGDWRNAYQQAYFFETPLRAVETGLHIGGLPNSTSFLKVEPAEFVVSSIKKAEYGRGWLVRGYNITGEKIIVVLKPWKVFRHVNRVNLAEEEKSSLKPATNGSVTFPVKGHEIVSVMFME